MGIRKNLAVAFFLVFSLDYFSKYLALKYLSTSAKNILGSLLTFSLSKNSGAAFGLGSGNGRTISIFAISVVAVVFYVGRRIDSRVWAYTLGVLSGGITGNLSDRVFRSPGGLNGSVVDWIKLPHWPTFNLADLAITLSLIFMAYLIWRKTPLNSERLQNG